MKAVKQLAISRTVYPIDYNANNRTDEKEFKKWQRYIFIENDKIFGIGLNIIKQSKLIPKLQFLKPWQKQRK